MLVCWGSKNVTERGPEVPAWELREGLYIGA